MTLSWHYLFKWSESPSDQRSLLFQFHNAQWLDIVQSQQQQDKPSNSHPYRQRGGGGPAGGGGAAGGGGGGGVSSAVGRTIFMDSLNTGSNSAHSDGGYLMDGQDEDDDEDEDGGLLLEEEDADGADLILRGVADIDLLSSSSSNPATAEIELGASTANKWP